MENKVKDYLIENANTVLESSAGLYGGTQSGAFRALNASNKTYFGLLHFAGMTALGIEEQNKKLDKLTLTIENLAKQLEVKPSTTTGEKTSKNTAEASKK